MSYGRDKEIGILQAEIRGCYEKVQDLDIKVNEQQDEMSQMKGDFKKTKEDLVHTRAALRDVTNVKTVLEKDQVCMKKKLHKANDECESTLSDLLCFEDDLLVKNSKLSEVVTSLGKDLAMDKKVSVQVKCGKKMYSDTIRQLYYSLLADQIPPAKIDRTIRSVLKTFLPSLNIVLPSERCAGYMRREELNTLSTAHVAYTVVESTSLDLNSDGTTKFLKKIGGVAVNGMVMCLNEVPDGSADSMIEDIARELVKLRDIAHALNFNDPEKINWTIFRSSTSDSASTQKRFNRLLEQRRAQDEERFGAVSSEGIELVENLCAMHLGSNLRKAFLDGTKAVISQDDEASDESPVQRREHDRTDTLIHEFCKLFGTHGVPEYGCGYSFADYLELKLGDCQSAEESEYYQSCTKVLLERQVGSRYFVSASNAAKIFFLIKAAIEYLQYTGRDNGNNLEQTLYRKLQDPEQLARLKADAIMFYFVYAELVMLAKSDDLKKSALDMNEHYLELQLFLQMVEDDPKAAMNKDHRVFVSEARLYGYNKVLNHRIRKSAVIFAQLFEPHADDWDRTLIYLATGAAKMNEKLSHYAKNQLPGGKYWEPDFDVQAVLRTEQ